MGRKPKIIPHIPGTLEQITDAIFAKDRVKRETEKKQKDRPKKDRKI